MIKRRKSRLLDNCTSCGKSFKEVNRYTYKNNKRLNGICSSNICSKCRYEKQYKRYKETEVGQRHIARSNKSASDRVKSFKRELITMKGGKCSSCGYSNLSCVDVFDFHHLDPKDKSFSLCGGNLRVMMHRRAEVFGELDKCIVLCANCHRKIHSESETIQQAS